MKTDELFEKALKGTGVRPTALKKRFRSEGVISSPTASAASL